MVSAYVKCNAKQKEIKEPVAVFSKFLYKKYFQNWKSNVREH